MKRILYPLSLGVLLSGAACKSTKTVSGTDANPRISASTSVPQGYYENARRTVAPATGLSVSADPEYGVTQKKPVCVGGSHEAGARSQQSYLNALRGPNGEEITYRRQGSCCAFKTPNGLINNMGLLDVYELTWAGNAKPLIVYLNFYDKGPLLAPSGLTVVQP
ncbi:hypothetical protein [Hymenobacter lucidus]|uniref:2-dehydro-3-deoxyphosphooctonate aldolase n=1 Tax=Hymenobacter lucidus TaxID=2880930 RepID=A0ABS8AXQ2_9BACT|nr:hypothetical protein [Hymenobacter lucidus]MCB2410553.1 hypothetical protein [Hymenobacter lucidus]